jgi:hypothetical protein
MQCVVTNTTNTAFFDPNEKQMFVDRIEYRVFVGQLAYVVNVQWLHVSIIRDRDA